MKTEMKQSGGKLEFDRREDKTGVKDVVTSFVDMTKAVFGKQRDNQMLKDLRVKKGLLTGLRYVVYITLVLPFRITAWVFTPRWEWVYFVRRHLVSPIFELEAISGNDAPSNILGELYEKYLNFLQSTGETGVKSTTVKPEISRLERLMIFAKLRVLITLLIFAIVAIDIYSVLSEFVDIAAFISAIISGLASGGFGVGSGASDAFVALLDAKMTYTVVVVLLASLISYIFIFALRFAVESFKSIMYADSTMMKEFIDDTLHYTVSKAIELHGEERAMQAYDLLLENVVINKSQYIKDEYYYKRLENQSDAPVIDKLIEEDHEND